MTDYVGYAQSAWTTGSGNLHRYNGGYEEKLQLLDTWIIMLTVLYSYGQFEVTFDDKYVCLQTFGSHRI